MTSNEDDYETVEVGDELSLFQSMEDLSDADKDRSEKALHFLIEDVRKLNDFNENLAVEVVVERQRVSEIITDLKSQGTILLELAKQIRELDKKFDEVTNIIKEKPDSAKLLEPLNQIQNTQKLLLKNRREIPPPQAGSTQGISSKSFKVLLFTICLMPIVSLLIAQFAPPRPTSKAEAQWYAIFQRVDRLYKDRFGNKKF